MSGQARDIKLSKQRIEGYRNFGTKLWNAARFCQMNGCVRVDGFDPGVGEPDAQPLDPRRDGQDRPPRSPRPWKPAPSTRRRSALYRFIWNVFCDWYLELAKPILNGADEAAKAETRAMAAWVLDQCLKLLHPVMPFLTEELWDRPPSSAPRDGLLMTAAWPDLPTAWIDAAGRGRDRLADRPGQRGALDPLGDERAALGQAAPDRGVGGARRARETRTLCGPDHQPRAGCADRSRRQPAQGLGPVRGPGRRFRARIAEFIDLAAERARLAKDLAALDADVERAAKKLGNPSFVERAAPEVVEETRAKQAEAEAAKAKLGAALARLEAAG